MAQDALVSADVEGGDALVRALDDSGFPVSAAFWLYYPEDERWRLMLATTRADDLHKAYVDIARVADAAGVGSPDLARISLVPPSDRTVRTLSHAKRTKGRSGVRVHGEMVDGLYVDDAYIYRTAA